MEIVLSEGKLDELKGALCGDVEKGAALLFHYDVLADRLLLHEIVVAADADCLSSTAVQFTFAPQFLSKVTRVASSSERALGLVHTHPAGFDRFSETDDATEALLCDFMLDRNPERPCLSVILCQGRLIAREFGAGAPIPVRIVGKTVVMSGREGPGETQDRYDRQVRAFGQAGQDLLRTLNVAIVGVGGTGSVAAQQLAHLGVGHFVLIDPDVVEETNLNRVVGTGVGSVGLDKVACAANQIGHINPLARVDVLKANVLRADAVAKLRGVDCVFICTDSHVSRALLSNFAYQYLIPSFDIGVSINSHDGKVEAITGRVQMIGPGLPCLWCSDALRADRIREELMTSEQRAADPYFNEGGERQPAVISINSTMVSLAVTMFLGTFTSIPVQARWQSYDAVTGRVRLLDSTRRCEVCGSAGLTATGPSKPLALAGMEPQ